jgi:hypothetical protein
MAFTNYAFPPESVHCEQGDHLLCETPDGRVVVYRVDDLLLVKRLVRLGNEGSDLVLEELLLDSVAPAYFNEVHLLLTALEPSLSSEEEAVEAIRTHQLTAKAEGLLRSAQDFTKSRCQVFRAS